jgi:PPK2 family polyphosphate:nucleotide phosphotransferase
MHIANAYRIAPHTKVKLSKISPRDTGPYKSEDEAKTDTAAHVKKLTDLQVLLAADAGKSLLIVLQAMDAGGKDGTISHIFTGVNPQGCDVTQFKVPTPIEHAHDYLWRIHRAVPAKGKIGIFNRSQYEDVLVTRVHNMISKDEAMHRCEQIVQFEKMLTENNVVILKFFLHISRKEQATRLKARLNDPDKRWKVSPADFKERPYWDAYQQAYEDAISATSRKHAPWYVVPSDYKWYRNAVISSVLVKTLRDMDLKYPKPNLDVAKLMRAVSKKAPKVPAKILAGDE